MRARGEREILVALAQGQEDMRNMMQQQSDARYRHHEEADTPRQQVAANQTRTADEAWALREELRRMCAEADLVDREAERVCPKREEPAGDEDEGLDTPWPRAPTKELAGPGARSKRRRRGVTIVACGSVTRALR